MTLTLAFGMTPATALAADDVNSEIVGEADASTAETESRTSTDSSALDGSDSASANDTESVEGDAPDAEGYDKAEFYAEGPEITSSAMLLSLGRISLVTISDDMKYFAYYESGSNYAQTLSSGDGYNALGYYQFDRRYSLVDFMKMCLEYDSDTYSMFSSLVSQKTLIEGSANPFYSNGSFTALGKQMNSAWKAAYNANPSEFSALQDTYAYQNYYVPVVNRLATLGIDLEERADCVKGLMWGAANLFGPGSYSYDNGICYFLKRANLSDSMTDEQIVTAFCDSVINNIKSYTPNQSQYWDGWINRYKKEKQNCLNYLASLEDSLTYNANGGTGKMSATEGTVNKDVKVANNSFVRDGYEFTGWNTKKDGSGKSYAAGSTYTLTDGDDVLYAQWKKIEETPVVPDDSDSSDSAASGDSGSSSNGDGSGGSETDSGSGSESGGESDGAVDSDGDAGEGGASNGNGSGDVSGGSGESDGESSGGNDSSGVVDGDSDESDSGSESDDAKPSNPPSNDAGLDGGSSAGGSSDGSSNNAAGTDSSDETGSNNDPGSNGGQNSGTGSGNASAESDLGSTSTDSNPKDDSTNDESDDGKSDASSDDAKKRDSESSDEGKETLLKTNDESAGIVAVLVGGFALAFGVAAGTLRRILGRS